jgi:hypothetical protein
LDGTVTIDYEKFGSKEEGLAYAKELYQYLKRWQSERYDPSDDDYVWRDIMHWFYDAVFKARAYGALKGEFRYKDYAEEINGLKEETEKLKNEKYRIKVSILRIHSNKEKLSQQVDNILIFNIDELNTFLTSENLPKFYDSGRVMSSMGYELNERQNSIDLALKNTPPLKAYFIANMLFSALIDADRMNAAGMEVPQKRNSIKYTSILRYISKVEKENREHLGSTSEIFRLRTLVRETVLSKINTEHKIFSLTAPTGSGKTLTALLFAAMMRQQTFKKYKRIPRIIYVCF